jgi:hypothetical protein
MCGSEVRIRLPRGRTNPHPFSSSHRDVERTGEARLLFDCIRAGLVPIERRSMSTSRCDICNCQGLWPIEGRHTPAGRSQLTHRNVVARTLFGRNRKTGWKDPVQPVFEEDPWDNGWESRFVCLECRDELLGQPVLLPWDMARLSSLIRQAGFAEDVRTTDRSKMAGRVSLFHEVISRGLDVLMEERACPFEPADGWEGYSYCSFWPPAGPWDEWWSRHPKSRERKPDWTLDRSMRLLELATRPDGDNINQSPPQPDQV